MSTRDRISRRAFNLTDQNFAVLSSIFNTFISLNIVDDGAARENPDAYYNPQTPWDFNMSTLYTYLNHLGFNDKFCREVYSEWARTADDAESVLDSVLWKAIGE